MQADVLKLIFTLLFTVGGFCLGITLCAFIHGVYEVLTGKCKDLKTYFKEV